MEINALQCFLCTAKHKNFTKAAEELYISQPTLSYHISNLERELGTSLFKRNKKNISLTEAGKILETEATAAMKHLHNAKEQITNLLMAEDTYRFGFLELMIMPCLYQFVDPFLKQHPNKHGILERRGFSIIYGLSDSNKYDFVFTRGLARLDPDTPKGLAFKILQPDYISVIVPSDHPLAEYDVITDLSVVNDEQLLIVDESISGNIFSSVLYDVFLDFGYIFSKPPIVVANIDDLLTQIVTKQGIAILPLYNSLDLGYKGIKLIRLADKTGPADVVVAWNPKQMNHKNQLYLDYLNENFDGDILYN